jgi:hypothetical protein
LALKVVLFSISDGSGRSSKSSKSDCILDLKPGVEMGRAMSGVVFTSDVGVFRRCDEP